MKKIATLVSLAALAAVAANAQSGEPFIHDPASIAECDGKYYTYGTGGAGLVSDDGWSWKALGERIFDRGAAPDVLKIGDRYLIAYSGTGGGLGGSHKGIVFTMWTKTLDPKSPDYKLSEPIEVASSEDGDDCDAIDAGLLLDPTTGRLWLTYGTYFGFIRLVELDPATGERVKGNEAINVAIDCEATTLMYNDGWYYLLGTHGTCCDGPNSTYNIVVGRSKQVTGPYLDNMGRSMLAGGGKMLIQARYRRTGAGHFGRYVEEKGVEKFSFHWESDYDQAGRSALAVYPLLWENGWPKAGDKIKSGETFWIESERRGYALELEVDFVRQQHARMFFWMSQNQPTEPLANQKLDEVQGEWPKGNINVRIGDYMFRPHQRWTITEVPEAGGYLDAPYYKIEIEGTNRALAATADKEVETVETFTGADEQLWRIEQLIDGTYRIMPKAVPGTSEKLVLVSTGDSTPSLGKFNFESDNSKWNLRQY